jgi:hypothetical protein
MSITNIASEIATIVSVKLESITFVIIVNLNICILKSVILVRKMLVNLIFLNITLVSIALKLFKYQCNIFSSLSV